MAEALDLEAYLGRVGYAGPRQPVLETLRALHLAHATSIPFENLDPLRRVPVGLDLESLQAKLVRSRRGGWCFEHNALFAAVLRSLGFDVTTLVARVVMNQPEGAITGRTHMLLRVMLGGEPWIADVGFGGQTLTGPVRLAAGEQRTPHEPYRLVESQGHHTLQWSFEGEWRSLYRFDLVPAHAPDYEMANWYLCTHPSSHFLQGLVAARAFEGGRYALRGGEFAVHTTGKPTVRRSISGSELRAVLENEIGIALPEGAEKLFG